MKTIFQQWQMTIMISNMTGEQMIETLKLKTEIAPIDDVCIFHVYYEVDLINNKVIDHTITGYKIEAYNYETQEFYFIDTDAQFIKPESIDRINKIVQAEVMELNQCI